MSSQPWARDRSLLTELQFRSTLLVLQIGSAYGGQAVPTELVLDVNYVNPVGVSCL